MLDISGPKLAQLCQGRDNNFNLIRILAAFAVLISHSYVIVDGGEAREPLKPYFNMTLGSVAVDIFFITSGFLVTASILNRKSTIDFLIARVLRIYPALIVMVFFCIGCLGLYFTSMTAIDFLTNHTTFVFAIKNTTLLQGTTGNLPGVFESNPYPNLVNVSLWTLPFEIRMYLALASIWILAGLFGKRREAVVTILIPLIAIISFSLHCRDHFFFQSVDQLHRLLFMFFAGGTYYVFRSSLQLSSSLFIFAISAIVVSSFHQEAFFITYNLTLAYMILCLAYQPTRAIRKYNKLGDYSYGLYIYAFPVQQCLIALHPSANVIEVIIVSTSASLFLAFLSWHIVEKQALAWKAATVVLTDRLLKRIIKK